jgi:hypothetical protein
MSKDIVQLFATTVLSDMEIECIPNDDLKDIVNHQLTRTLADTIMDNIKDSPVEYKVEPLITQYEYPKRRYMIRINIISDAELSRLKRIEAAYKKLIEE